MPVFQTVPCPACGSTDTNILGAPDLSKDPVGAPSGTRIVECASCGHLRVDPMPHWSPEDFAKLYGDGYFVPDSPKWARLRAEVNPAARLERVKELLRTSERSVLEIGSGIYAHFATLLSRQGWKALAQEPSADFREALASKGLDVDGRGFEELPEDRKFAVLYADSVFEHVADPGVYFDKASRLLLPGGVLYLVFPRERSLLGNLKHLVARLRGRPCPLLAAYRPPYHLQGFTARSVEHFARRSGLRLALVHVREDWFWLQALERLPPVAGHLAALVLWTAERMGMGGNLEVGLVKDPG